MKTKAIETSVFQTTLQDHTNVFWRSLEMIESSTILLTRLTPKELAEIK